MLCNKWIIQFIYTFREQVFEIRCVSWYSNVGVTLKLVQNSMSNVLFQLRKYASKHGSSKSIHTRSGLQRYHWKEAKPEIFAIYSLPFAFLLHSNTEIGPTERFTIAKTKEWRNHLNLKQIANTILSLKRQTDRIDEEHESRGTR